MQSDYVWYGKNTGPFKADSLHQTLAYGTINDIKRMKQGLGRSRLRKFFLEEPKKVYTKSQLNFIKNFILNISQPIDEGKYLKDTPRRIR